MIKKISLISLMIVLGNVVAAQEYQIPKTEWGVPDFPGSLETRDGHAARTSNRTG